MGSSQWQLDPDVTFLNHGSFGACPTSVLAAQQRWRDRLEREPVAFFMRELEPALDQARQRLAAFVGAEAPDLVFVPNATSGVNAVLRSLALEPGDELLTTDHVYNACGNALQFVAERSGAVIKTVAVPFPLDDSEEIVSRVMAGVTARTRLALLDHVTSATGLILPIERLLDELHGRGVEVLVDGAHAPGMVPLDLGKLPPSCAYYTGNCHKWLCAPKGAAFLYVRRDLHAGIRPLTISHGANSARTDRSRLHLEFDWTGTDDPTPFLCVPDAIDFVSGLMEGGLPALRAHNKELVLKGRDLLLQVPAVRELNPKAPCPDSMIGSLSSLWIPEGDLFDLQDKLFLGHRIEVPVMPWPAPPSRLLRISAQFYNHLEQYEKLAAVLPDLLS